LSTFTRVLWFVFLAVAAYFAVVSAIGIIVEYH
jgi:hypothetical protein